MNKHSDHEVTLESIDEQIAASEKETWVKPEITDFKPVTVAQGISYRIGDGISNLC
jgi:hypothetical protein